MSISKTIVISCAGMGTRLGMNMNKSLIDIHGKPLIIRQLECMDKFNDIRIVVGYQAEEVIKVVNSYRRDITFVFNHRYKETKTASSLCLGKKYANDIIVSLDGDTLFKKEDFYSEELQDNYNAIYRTKTELEKIIQQTLLNKGFSIKESSPLFKEDGLNNRKETIQYYFLLER